MSVAGLIHYAAGIIGKCHTVVNTHRESRIFFFKYAAELNKVCTATQVRCLGKVTVGENVA